MRSLHCNASSQLYKPSRCNIINSFFAKCLMHKIQWKEEREKKIVQFYWNQVNCLLIKHKHCNHGGGSRAAITSKMEHFVIIVNSWNPVDQLEPIKHLRWSFCKNSKRLKAVYYFRKKAPSQMFDWFQLLSQEEKPLTIITKSSILGQIPLWKYCTRHQRHSPAQSQQQKHQNKK